MHACARLGSRNRPGRVEVETPDFIAPQSSNTRVSENIVIATTTEINDGFRRLRSARLPACESIVLTDTVRQDLGARAAAQGYTIGSVSTGQLSFPTIGDGTAAVTLSLPVTRNGRSMTLYADYVWVRHRNSTIGLSFENLDSPFNLAMSERIARSAYAKLENHPSSTQALSPTPSRTAPAD
jgi:hypothetical protein